ncbi:MAG: adenosylcobinamide-GDP ribazoletransferase [Pseudomonadota bacterium]|jgi:adenosylcobinamide-GDP ribazoletransferase|nr:adenosylcobinamide-GDP ribazoletransferase [Pseudomonadota bacterium]
MFRLAKQEAQALAIALGLLTRIPVRVRGGASGEVGAATLGRSLHWYPAAGLVIGLILTLLAALLPGDFLLNAKPLNSLLLNAALITTAWLALTGALHLDGLADCADAWVGGMGDRARTLAIMKDPACGPIGVVAIVMVLLVKVAALDTLLTGASGIFWWLIPVLARTVLPLAFVSLPYVREGGMGDGLARNASRPGLILAVLLVLGLLALCLPLLLLCLWLAVAVAVFALWRRAMIQRLGGFTGDGAGALVELLEVALLVATALFVQTQGLTINGLVP